MINLQRKNSQVWAQLLCNEKLQKVLGVCILVWSHHPVNHFFSCEHLRARHLMFRLSLSSVSRPAICNWGQQSQKASSYLSYLTSSPTSLSPLIGRYIVQHEPAASGSLRHSVCGEIRDRLIIIFWTNKSPICSPQHSECSGRFCYCGDNLNLR